MHFDVSTEKDGLSDRSIYELPALGFLIDMNMSHNTLLQLAVHVIYQHIQVGQMDQSSEVFHILYKQDSYLSTVLLALWFFTCDILFDCIEDKLLSNS